MSAPGAGCVQKTENSHDDAPTQSPAAGAGAGGVGRKEKTRDRVTAILVRTSGRYAASQPSLERVRASYHMVGLPINVTYTDRNAIIKRVRETNIFLADAKKIQFALSVYVHAYPNQVCSVWVYCASLEDLRAGSSSRSS